MDLSNASPSTYRATVASAAAGVNYSRSIIRQVASRMSLPLQVVLVGDVFEHFILAQPIILNFEHADAGKIIASDDIFYMYGEGNTRQQAVHDYVSSLSEYYALLESHDDAPSVALFSYLRTYLHPN